MSREKLGVSVVALTIALAMACTSRTTGPTSPSTLAPGATAAAADGSTLKATAPSPTSPINAVKLPPGPPVILVVTNATTPYVSGITLVYRFEVQTAGGAVVESQVVAGGAGTTSRTVAAALDGDATYRWRARAEYQESAGPWSGLQSFVAPVNDGYNRPGALFDPLVNGKTVGRIGGSGNVTWVPGQGIRMNDELAYVVYQLPQVYSSGEISVEVTGLNPDGPCCKPRIFSMLDRTNAIASASRYSFNVQYRGAGGAPANCITFKAVLGDNANSVEVDNRFGNIFRLDPSKVYLWQAFWTPTSFRLAVKEGGATGPVVYDEKADATSGTTNWNPEQMFAFLGTNNGAYVEHDGTRAGMTLRNLWVGSTPRPATLP
jgi:hypothetical protein